MKPSILMASVVAPLLLAACGDTARSASYFQDHEIERHAVLKNCKAGTARGRECENAELAQARASSAEAESIFRARIEAK